MDEQLDIDKLDKKILSALQKDARRPFQELARDMDVSGGTVHVRFNKLKDLGVITGSHVDINYGKLGYDVTAFIGINLHNAGDYAAVLEKLRKMEEITEAYYTTGNYSIFIRVITKSTEGLHEFLTRKLQPLKEIQSTETFISLYIPIKRDICFE